MISGVVVLRFALAIVFDALAFTIWDVGRVPRCDWSRDVAAARACRACSRRA